MSMHYKLFTASDDTDFGKKAADVLIDLLQKYSSRTPKVILPTGNTPLPLYAELRKRGAAALPRMEYFQLDEYLGLAADHPRLFLNEMKANLLGPLGIPLRSAFSSATKNNSGQLDAVGSKFSFFGHPDIAVIGIGPNGHVGFNEPNTKFDEGPHVVRLSRETIQANSKDWDVAKFGEFPETAITLGIKDLKQAQHTILLVRGEAKACILAKAFHGDVTEKVPASYLQQQRNVTIVADRAALSAFPS